MSDKDLQRVTKCVSEYRTSGSTSSRSPRPPSSHHAKNEDRRSVYALLSVHDDTRPAEIFLRVNGSDYSSELIGLYAVIAHLMSLALQYGAPA